MHVVDPNFIEVLQQNFTGRNSRPYLRKKYTKFKIQMISVLVQSNLEQSDILSFFRHKESHILDIIADF